MESVMGDVAKAWDGDRVRGWLDSRVAAARVEQAAADRRGYAAQDDYDKAAAEEWACRALTATGSTDDQAGFASRVKNLIGQDEYPATGIHDDRRFERHVRETLRKIARMAKTNEGFENTLRFQR